MKLFRKLCAWLGFRLLMSATRSAIAPPATVTLASVALPTSGTLTITALRPSDTVKDAAPVEQLHAERCPCIACLTKREQALQAGINAWNETALSIPPIRWQPTDFPMRLQ